jgi:hypothetical protein
VEAEGAAVGEIIAYEKKGLLKKKVALLPEGEYTGF